jgi:hypothetical protein
VVALGTPVQLRGLTIRGGNTAGDGGGIANNGANLQLQDVTLRSNVAGGDGGGMFNQRGLATIVASRIAGNYAGGAGGNIANSAPQGGAFWNSGSAAIVNSIIAAGTGGTCSNAGVIQSAGSNLDQANTCGFNAAGDQQNVDPLLALLAWNGGTTRTHALAPASPAVDQGRSDMCSMSDQRGFPRLRDGNLGDIASCDVGAYELSRIAIHLPLIIRP